MAFKKYGEIIRFSFLSFEGQIKMRCYLEFKTQESAMKALSHSGTKLGVEKKACKVDYVKPRGYPSSNRGAIRGGGRGRGINKKQVGALFLAMGNALMQMANMQGGQRGRGGMRRGGMMAAGGRGGGMGMRPAHPGMGGPGFPQAPPHGFGAPPPPQFHGGWAPHMAPRPGWGPPPPPQPFGYGAPFAQAWGAAQPPPPYGYPQAQVAQAAYLTM